MFSHIMVGSNDLKRSKAFYDAVLATVGAGESIPNEAPSGHNRLFYRHNGVMFGISQPINGEPATVGNGSTVGFACASPDQVNAFHAAAVANGGVSIEDPPGVRQSKLGEMYLAYVRDPDGNKLCAGHFSKK